MTVFKNQYIASKQNGSIVASGKETFGLDQSSQEARTKWGSFNFFSIISQSNQAVTLNFDGGDIRKIALFANASVALPAEDGIFFNTLTLINQSAVDAITAGKITVTFGRSIPIPKT